MESENFLSFFCLNSQRKIFCSRWNVFTIDGATGNIYGPVQQGTSWVSAPGTPAIFTSISTSQSGLNVWGASNGMLYRRSGITDANKMGTSWVAISGRTSVVGVAASDVGVWVWDQTGHIFARDGVSATTPAGSDWLEVPSPRGSLITASFDGLHGVATTDDGLIWWRVGISSSNPVGTHWAEVPGRMTVVSVFGSSFWGVRQGHIFRRAGMRTTPPAGTGWDEIPGSASRISASSGNVWAVTDTGRVFYRQDITPCTFGLLISSLNRLFSANEAGASWGEVDGPTRLKVVSAGNGVVWGLDMDDSPVFREGVARSNF